MSEEGHLRTYAEAAIKLEYSPLDLIKALFWSAVLSGGHICPDNGGDDERRGPLYGTSKKRIMLQGNLCMIGSACAQ